MAAIPNTIGLTGAIAPIDSNDTYFTHYAQYGLGGFYAVADITARDNISPLRLEDGLLVKVLSDGKYYTYSTGVWTEEAFGGSSLTYEVKNADFTAAPNFIYGIDTTAGVVVATLPVGVAGDQIHFTDARYTFGTNKLTLNAASGETIAGLASVDLDRHRDTISLVYDAVANDWVIWGTEASKATGGSAGSSLTYQIKSADFVTVRDHIYGVDTSISPITVTLGVVPNSGIVHISDITGNAEINNITIVPTGGTISGGANLQLTKNFECVSLVYDATNTNWVIWGTESSGIGGGGIGLTNRIFYGNTEVVIPAENGDINFTLAGFEAGGFLKNPQSGGFYCNVALGVEAMKGANKSSIENYSNIAIGIQALYNNSWYRNIAIGQYSLFDSTTGVDNIAIGASAMLNNTSGADNIALGISALGLNTTGSNNIGIGIEAGGSNTTSDYIISIGSNAGDFFNPKVDTALAAATNNTGNIYIGANALPSSAISVNEITLGGARITALRCAVTSITSLSDRRDKANIQPLEVGLDFINSLTPVTYQWDKREWYNEEKDGSKLDAKINVGFVAQDLQEAQEIFEADYLDLVYDSNPDKLEATPGNLLYTLVKAIQELSEQVSEQAIQIQQLTTLINQ